MAKDGLNGDVMADEIIKLMGGRRTRVRMEYFRKLCWGIIQHFQNHGYVIVQVSTPSGPGSGTGDIK